MCFVKNSITFKKPVGYGQVITQSLPAFAKKHTHYFGNAHIKIIVLLHMPEFVYGQLLGPGQTADIKAILFGC